MMLSIIIPVYNVERYVEECVNSIFQQGLEEDEFEVILVNDGSTDKSKELCERLVAKNSNIFLYNQSNQGQSVARNYGLNKAKGEFISFVDSDDYLLPGYFKELLILVKRKRLDFIGFDYELTNKRFTSSTKSSPLNLIVVGSGIEILGKHNYNNGPCWYIVKKNTIGSLRFEEGRLCEDGLFTTQLLLKVDNGEIYSNKIYSYYENIHSTVKSINLERQIKIMSDMFYAANRFKLIIDLLPPDVDPKCFKRLKERQESYTFFGLVRYLRNRKSYEDLKPVLKELGLGKYSAYPIKTFQGYDKRVNKVLISVFNNKVLLEILINLNIFLKIIR